MPVGDRFSGEGKTDARAGFDTTLLFLRRGEAEPLHYAYPKQHVKAAFIILGNPLSADELRTTGMSPPRCNVEHRAGGLLFSGKDFRLSTGVA
ncbi:hypothetical protein CWS02_17735 [Enterobacter sp. EA-1]|nr:hypothetical protein CWS02_17735 [Enterobacter sp. EA-1]